MPVRRLTKGEYSRMAPRREDSRILVEYVVYISARDADEQESVSAPRLQAQGLVSYRELRIHSRNERVKQNEEC